MADGAVVPLMGSGGPFMRPSSFQVPSAPVEAPAPAVGGRRRGVIGGPIFVSGDSRPVPRYSPRIARVPVASSGVDAPRPSHAVARSCTQTVVHSAASGGLHGPPRTSTRFVRTSVVPTMSDGASVQAPSVSVEASASSPLARVPMVSGGVDDHCSPPVVP